MICLYMIILIAAACLGESVQMIGKIYVGEWSSFISSGSDFRYNYAMYIIGMVFFFGIMHVLYERLLKARYDIRVKYFGENIFTCIVIIIGCILMFAAMIIEVLCIFGFTNNIGPDVLFWITMAGWPIGTAIYLLFRVIASA